MAAPLLLTTVPAGAVSGPATTAAAYGFTARIDIGGGKRACSGALVDPRWVVTAASCFSTDLTTGTPPAEGKPAEKTTVTVGRTDLTGTAGLVTEVTELIPYQGRDMVLARLAQPASGIAPVAFATTAPAAGETLKIAGFGRTKSEWSPLSLHTGSFTVGSVEDGQVAITGQDGAAVCAGDAGGPLLREKDGKLELVGVNSRSWQGGCYGTDASETRTGAISARMDDSAAQTWFKEGRDRLRTIVHTADVNGDGRSDLIIQGVDGTITVRTAKATVAAGANRFNAGVAWSAGWANFTGQPGKGRLYFADINGDGKADMIVHGTDGVVAVRINKGTYFDAGTNWSVGWGNFLGQEGKGRLYFADINGDGKADMIVHGTDGVVAVRINTGTYFDSGTNWSTGWGNFLGQEGKGRLYFADISGDGKADMIVHGADGVLAVRTNTGTYFDSGTNWSTGWGNFLGHPKGSLSFSDVSGDGKADLFVYSTDGKIATRLNAGTYFQVAPGDDWI